MTRPSVPSASSDAPPGSASNMSGGAPSVFTNDTDNTNRPRTNSQPEASLNVPELQGPSTLDGLDHSFEEGKLTGRRAERACEKCRRSKVKCQQVPQSTQCVRCETNGWECTDPVNPFVLPALPLLPKFGLTGFSTFGQEDNEAYSGNEYMVAFSGYPARFHLLSENNSWLPGSMSGFFPPDGANPESGNVFYDPGHSTYPPFVDQVPFSPLEYGQAGEPSITGNMFADLSQHALPTYIAPDPLQETYPEDVTYQPETLEAEDPSVSSPSEADGTIDFLKEIEKQWYQPDPLQLPLLDANGLPLDPEFQGAGLTSHQ